MGDKIGGHSVLKTEAHAWITSLKAYIFYYFYLLIHSQIYSIEFKTNILIDIQVIECSLENIQIVMNWLEIEGEKNPSLMSESLCWANLWLFETEILLIGG